MSANLHRVRLAGSDTEFACAADDTLLRAAQRAGLGFPYECNVGSCGNCKFELLDGEVVTAWAQAPGLSDKDRQRQRYLGCQTRPRGDCSIKLRPAARYAPVVRPQRMGATLTGMRAITHDISEFSFRLDAPQRFEPGQYALFWLPGVDGPRAYSMSNTADGDGAGADGSVWDVQVRRVPGGQGSARLFALQPGARVEVDGPYGMAWLRRDAPRDILCLAGGSGLAPMVSIARGAMAEPRLAAQKLHFVYGGRTAADLCGQDMLRRLPGWGERLHYHGYISTAPEADAAVAVPQAFVHDAALALFGSRLPAMELYFAGPPAMAQAVQRMLFDAGVPPEQQHFDQFY
jgi:toluene monooxygenase electron transfer component